jgi:hypothetical protein
MGREVGAEGFDMSMAGNISSVLCLGLLLLTVSTVRGKTRPQWLTPARLTIHSRPK